MVVEPSSEACSSPSTTMASSEPYLLGIQCLTRGHAQEPDLSYRENCDHVYHAVDVINNKTDGLFDYLNVTLALTREETEGEDCGHARAAFQALQHRYGANLTAVVGGTWSSCLRTIGSREARDELGPPRSVLLSPQSAALSLTNETAYPNVARLISSTRSQELAASTLFVRFGWQRVAIAHDTGLCECGPCAAESQSAASALPRASSYPTPHRSRSAGKGRMFAVESAGSCSRSLVRHVPVDRGHRGPCRALTLTLTLTLTCLLAGATEAAQSFTVQHRQQAGRDGASAGAAMVLGPVTFSAAECKNASFVDEVGRSRPHAILEALHAAGARVIYLMTDPDCQRRIFAGGLSGARRPAPPHTSFSRAHARPCLPSTRHLPRSLARPPLPRCARVSAAHDPSTARAHATALTLSLRLRWLQSRTAPTCSTALATLGSLIG